MSKTRQMVKTYFSVFHVVGTYVFYVTQETPRQNQMHITRKNENEQLENLLSQYFRTVRFVFEFLLIVWHTIQRYALSR